MGTSIDFKKINQEALMRCPELLRSWLPGGTVEGNRYHCGSLEGGSGRSFYVYLDTGAWEEANGGDGGGDLVALYAAQHGLKMREAAIDIAHFLGLELGIQELRNQAKSKAYPKVRLEGEWDYVDEQGNLLFQVKKYRDVATGGKKFVQFTPDGKGGNKPGIKGVRRVIYRLPEVLAVDVVFICEGEKDADSILAVYEQGTCAATCNPMGAGKWRDEYNTFFEGKTVWILQDNDEAGRLHSAKVFNALKDVVASIGIIVFPDLAEHGDVTDFIESYTDKNEAAHALNQRISEVEVYCKPRRFVTLGELLATEFSSQGYVIADGILPTECGMLLAGESGMGKSMLRNELAIHLCLGWPFLGLGIHKAWRVLVVQVENSARTEQIRLRAMFQGLGIDPQTLGDRLMLSDLKEPIDLGCDISRAKLMADIRQAKAEIVILDPLSCMHVENENDNGAMRRILDHVTFINRALGVTSIVIDHFNKPKEGSKDDVAYRLRGASSKRDWADTFVTLSREKHATRLLRKLEFHKVRNGPEPKPIVIERDKNSFLSSIYGCDVIYPSSKIRALVEGSEGSCVGSQGKLCDLIAAEVKGSRTQIIASIERAVADGVIRETKDPNHSQRLIYDVPSRGKKTDSGRFS